MPAQLLDGQVVASRIKQFIGNRVACLSSKSCAAPCLAIVSVGASNDTKTYIKNKQKACEQSGIQFKLKELPENVSYDELVHCIQELNSCDDISGILVQLPLPDKFNPNEILEYISPWKDVDGFHPYNIGRLVLRNPVLRPCTSFGIITLIRASIPNFSFYGVNAVIVGASNLVGRPMALELLLAGSTVTHCHRFTVDLQNHIERAQLVIIAAGRSNIVNGSWIRRGAIVVDCGVHRLTDGRIVGDLGLPTDVSYNSVQENAGWMTPVPGGVGPMTVAMLLYNTLRAHEIQLSRREKNGVLSPETNESTIQHELQFLPVPLGLSQDEIVGCDLYSEPPERLVKRANIDASDDQLLGNFAVPIKNMQWKTGTLATDETPIVSVRESIQSFGANGTNVESATSLPSSYMLSMLKRLPSIVSSSSGATANQMTTESIEEILEDKKS